MERANKGQDSQRAILIVVLFFSFLVTVRTSFLLVTIKGKSMFPTLKEGEKVLVYRRLPLQWVHRGQLILITLKASNEYLVKRLVGIQGDIVSEYNYEHIKESRVDENEIYVLGDNLQHSTDSRRWGTIPITAIKGVIIIRI